MTATTTKKTTETNKDNDSNIENTMTVTLKRRQQQQRHSDNNEKGVVVLSKEEKDYTVCNIKDINSENKEDFRNCIIVPDDTAHDLFKKEGHRSILYTWFTGLKTTTRFHKACHVDNLCRGYTYTTYMTTYWNPAFFQEKMLIIVDLISVLSVVEKNKVLINIIQ